MNFKKSDLKTFFIIFPLLFLLLPDLSPAEDASQIIKRVEDNLNGKTAVMEISMTVITQHGKRTIKMKSYSIGKEKSFIKILFPGKDKGITFLKIDNNMWQYVPRIEKTIKIPASMMLQSWMGSDFSNDDLVRESSISDDYTAKFLRKSEDVYLIELLPKEEAAVVWGKIIMEISKHYYLPTRVSYYDENNTLIRELIYSDIRSFGKRFYATKWLMLPREAAKRGHETHITISNAVFDEEVSRSYFSKRALKRFSR